MQSNSKNTGSFKGGVPHRETRATTQHVVIRLKDSLPSTVLAEWEAELRAGEPGHRDMARVRRIEKALDSGGGRCWLTVPAVAKVVEDTLIYFDGVRYQLHAWVVMPNHVHVLLSLGNNFALPSIVHSWKSFSAHEANRIIGRDGAFWQDDYFDRQIRNERHFLATIRYIEQNPVQAGLVTSAERWEYGSARRRRVREPRGGTAR